MQVKQLETVIKEKLQQMEKDYKIKIIFACEGGSRSRELSSPDSDYDVRFIYVHPPEWYLSVKAKKDVIELPVAGKLEFHGWDIRKALFLLSKSNPQLLEWLNSSVVYCERSKLSRLFREKSSEHFNRAALIHHYVSMAVNNKRQLGKGHDEVKLVLNILRPVLACRWAEKYASVPPASFYSLLEAAGTEDSLRDEVLKLAESKKKRTYGKNENIPLLIFEYIEKELSRLKEFAAGLGKADRSAAEEDLDELFRYSIAEMWGRSFQVGNE
jgi:predicted nucleotidyltransferase